MTGRSSTGGGLNARLVTMEPPEPAAEPDPVVEAYKKDVDRTLLRENLRRSPEERILALMELQRFAAELRRAGRELRTPS